MPVLSELLLYPIKSCGGIVLQEATLTAAGLMSEHIYDREWMVVDENGEFLTQRTHPRMALITPRIKADTLELRAPGMMRLEIPLDLPDPATAPTLMVRVWNDKIKAYDCDDTTATWFSNVLGAPCRLVRFHPDAIRQAEDSWTGGLATPTLFSDGFPLLVISKASLNDLNEKLQQQKWEALPMNRFRPNIVMDGTGPFEEDFAESITIGQAVIKPVKPCARCAITSIDQNTGTFGTDPLRLLQTYRANPKLDGGITFGMNAVVLSGEGEILRVGQQIEIALSFENG